MNRDARRFGDDAAAIAAAVSEGVIVLSRSGAILHVNARFADFSGPSGASLGAGVALRRFALLTGEGRAFIARAHRALRDERPRAETLSLVDGRTVVWRCLPRPELSLAVWTFEDITDQMTHVENLNIHAAELEYLYDHLADQARRDPLTSVLNHGAIVEVLRDSVAGGPTSTCAVAMVDVDGMKAVNDTYGHRAGDAVLVAVASALQRAGAKVGRYGGDEFVVVLPNASESDAERYRRDVIDALQGDLLRDPETGATLPANVTIGLAMFPSAAERIEDLIAAADASMYDQRRERRAGPHAASLPRPIGDPEAAAMLGEIVPILIRPGSLEQRFSLAAQRLTLGTGYDAVDIAFFGARRERPLAQGAFARLPDELLQPWLAARRSRSDEHIRAALEQTRRALFLADPDPGRDPSAPPGLLSLAKLRSAVVVPMFDDDRIVGSISAASNKESDFGPDDAQFLATLGQQVAQLVRVVLRAEGLDAAAA